MFSSGSSLKRTLGIYAVSQPYLFERPVKFPHLEISLQKNTGSDYNYKKLELTSSILIIFSEYLPRYRSSGFLRRVFS